MIGFGDAVGRYYTNYFNFSGRASRAEYWWPVLMQVIIYIGLVIILVMSISTNSASDDVGPVFWAVLIFMGLFWLVNIIPSYAVAARRFHDLDQTGWLVLVFVIANAIIGITAFAQIIWFAMPGTQGPNQYGPDPYGHDADIFG